jgi:hypothetical protein
MRESRLLNIVRSPKAVAAIAALACAACKVPEATLGAGIEARGEYAEASRFRVLVTQGGVSRVIDGASMRVRAGARASSRRVATTSLCVRESRRRST